MVTVVEGESLVNDATALVFYRTAVVATVTGAFSLWEAGGRLVLNAVAGVVIGLAVGYVIRQIRRRIDHPDRDHARAADGYLAYLPAEALGVSAVLAAVTPGSTWAGTRRSSRRPEPPPGRGVLADPRLRHERDPLHAHRAPAAAILDGLTGWSASRSLVSAVAVCAAVVLIRLVLVFRSRTCRAFSRRASAHAIRTPRGRCRSCSGGPACAAPSRSRRRSRSRSRPTRVRRSRRAS